MASTTDTRAPELEESLRAVYKPEDGWSGLEVVPASPSVVKIVGVFRGHATSFTLPTARSNTARLMDWATRSLDAHAEIHTEPEIAEVAKDGGPVELKVRNLSVEAKGDRVVLTVPGEESKTLALLDMHPKDALTLMDKIFRAARLAMRE